MKDKFVTYEVFKKYHEFLMGYIKCHDEVILGEEVFCPECGELIIGDECEKCKNKTGE